jgi:hypothetical protein
VLTCLVLVMGVSISIVGQSNSELVESAWAQTTMDNETNATTAKGNMTAGAGNMTDSNVTGNGKISGTGTELF